MTQPRRTLLGVLRERLALRHVSPRTVEAYAGWVRRFVRYHRGRHPRDLGERDVTAYLTHLAVERHVASSTQNQALAALLFLYGEVLETPVGWLHDVVRAKRPVRTPVVMSRDEARRVIDGMTGPTQLIAQLLYGSGLRLMEACSLRLKDVDLDRHELVVRHGKGGKDRLTMLPDALAPLLDAQMQRARALHLLELAARRSGCRHRAGDRPALDSRLRTAHPWSYQRGDVDVRARGLLATVTDHPGSRLTHQLGLSLTHQVVRTAYAAIVGQIQNRMQHNLRYTDWDLLVAV